MVVRLEPAGGDSGVFELVKLFVFETDGKRLHWPTVHPAHHPDNGAAVGSTTQVRAYFVELDALAIRRHRVLNHGFETPAQTSFIGILPHAVAHIPIRLYSNIAAGSHQHHSGSKAPDIGIN